MHATKEGILKKLATLVYIQSLTDGSNSPILRVPDYGASDHVACTRLIFQYFGKILKGPNTFYIGNYQADQMSMA